MADNFLLFSIFIFLSVLAALTEGLSITLLMPILDSQSMNSSFSDIPVLGHISHLFEGYEGSDKLFIAALFLLFVVLFRFILLMSVSVLSMTIPIKVQKKLTVQGFNSILFANINYINSCEVGEHLNNIKERPMRVTALLKSMADIITLVFILSVYTVMMFLVSWQMTIASVLVLGLFSWLLKLFNASAIRRLGERRSKSLASYNQTLYEALEGMELIRLKSAEQNVLKRFYSTLEDTLDIQRKTDIYYAIPGPAMATGVGVFICVLLIIGAHFSTSDTQQLTSQLFLFLFLLMRLMGPVTGLNTSLNVIRSDAAALRETNEFLKTIKNNVYPNGTLEYQKLSKDIEFRDVQFSYEKEDDLIINNLSGTIPRNSLLAIVGPSGAGKSTLVSLISRLYDPQEGSVCIDGVDLRDLRVESWRKRISIVSQNTILFNDTVANNIAFGNETATEEDVIAAAKLAHADTFIKELPEGYNTMLGDRGVRLSGGQRQRLSIARAFLSDPDVLIMDEGTSSLDSVTEKEIQNSVEQLSKDRTLIVIAHRLSTIKTADHIWVLDKGEIVQEGSHAQLAEQAGIYKEMLSHQHNGVLNEEYQTVLKKS